MSEEISNSVNEAKEVAYYTVLVEAWHLSALERDKSLLTLSAGGVGLLTTLLTTVGAPSFEGLILYSLAMLAFIVTLISVLFIFSQNKRHIEDVISKNHDKSALLSTLDTIAMASFIVGVILSFCIGIAAATH